MGHDDIGRGGLAATYVDPSPPADRMIDEATVLQPYLSNLIDGGKVPPPDGDTLYMVHLPGSVQVHQVGGATTCTDDCAYHFFYEQGGTEVRYAVIPDQNSGACASNPRCPLTLAAFDRITLVSSHELVEAVTDPEFGDGWYDSTPGCEEVGDICRGQPGMAAGYVVQLEWSNKNDGCVDHDPSTMTGGGCSVGAGGTGGAGSIVVLIFVVAGRTRARRRSPLFAARGVPSRSHVLEAIGHAREHAVVAKGLAHDQRALERRQDQGRMPPGAGAADPRGSHHRAGEPFEIPLEEHPRVLADLGG